MEEKIVDIYDISYQGAGVGRSDGKIVFVPKTLVGEKVSFAKKSETGSYILGEMTRVLSPSERRIDAKCPYFQKCGGCSFQHCDYQEEKEIKKQILKNELQKVSYDGDIGFIESKNRFNYRNKVKFEVRNGKLGYFKEKSRDFFAVKNCPIADEKINDLIEKVETFIEKNQFKMLKSVYLKRVYDDIAIVFLFCGNDFKSRKNVKAIEILGEVSVYFAYGEVLESNKTHILFVSGKKSLSKKVGESEISVDVSAFNQINDDIADKMYNYVVSKCADYRVVNAYSGQGLLTLLISQKAKFVYGIEYQISAHNSAEKLIEGLEEYKIQNICGKVEERLPEILMKDKIEIIVLDPARNGCHKNVLEAILNSKLNKIIYISCNFSTLVRDLAVLKQNYEINEVKIFDMFPCCCSMETVVCLSKRAD